jgi:TRAP-type uncharacterized transport system fused permease subunit
VLFYLSVFMTVHFVALRRGLAIVPEDEMPAWGSILAPRRVLPILCALGGLGIGIWMGRSISTSAFYGIIGLLIAFFGTETGRLSLREMAGKLLNGLEDAGKGLVIIGVLLAGAQVLVSMINLTGIGVTLSSLIVSMAGDSMVLVALIVGAVCLVMGMGLPTTAAYVLVAAVLAPAMTAVGVDPLAAHLFVFYFATISVITPPVCVAVFVGAGIAGTNWLPAAGEAVRLGAVTYIVPFLLLLYPGMLLGGSALDILEAVAAGLVLVLAVPALLSGARLYGRKPVDVAIYTVVIALAIYPQPVTPFLALAILVAAHFTGRVQRRALA